MHTATLTPAQVAAADQAQAREREFDRKAAKVARVFLIVMAVLGVYAALATYGMLPALPWSPVAHAQAAATHAAQVAR